MPVAPPKWLQLGLIGSGSGTRRVPRCTVPRSTPVISRATTPPWMSPPPSFPGCSGSSAPGEFTRLQRHRPLQGGAGGGLRPAGGRCRGLPGRQHSADPGRGADRRQQPTPTALSSRSATSASARSRGSGHRVWERAARPPPACSPSAGCGWTRWWWWPDVRSRRRSSACGSRPTPEPSTEGHRGSPGCRPRGRHPRQRLVGRGLRHPCAGGAAGRRLHRRRPPLPPPSRRLGGRRSSTRHPAADGVEMLLFQGMLSFQRWTGVDPPWHAARAALEEALAG